MGQIHGLEDLILESQATQPAVNTFFFNGLNLPSC